MFFGKVGRWRTIVTDMAKSSQPTWLPPKKGTLAIIRSRNANNASAPPVTPDIEMILVRSRTGASHAVLVMFNVARDR